MGSLRGFRELEIPPIQAPSLGGRCSWSSVMISNQLDEKPRSIQSLEQLLEEVDRTTPEGGHAMLFCGGWLRLEIALIRADRQSPLRWGHQAHEAWVFKATMLRFARGADPVRLLVETGPGNSDAIGGWVLSRSSDRFSAARLSIDQSREFLARCHAHSGVAMSVMNW